ncbi:hypothetical protein QQP08_020685 [Theobroma cacao]|nr:hypothetical protein QQP08_020685 [Theobroma cacao]
MNRGSCVQFIQAIQLLAEIKAKNSKGEDASQILQGQTQLDRRVVRKMLRRRTPVVTASSIESTERLSAVLRSKIRGNGHHEWKKFHFFLSVQQFSRLSCSHLGNSVLFKKKNQMELQQLIRLYDAKLCPEELLSAEVQRRGAAAAPGEETCPEINPSA